MERKLFYGLLIINLLPLWLCTYFPSQDGPAHLYNARIIGDWYWSDPSVFRAYLVLNDRLDPTWFVHLILAGLMKLFSPNVSEKLFLTIYVLALPLSIRYALNAINADARFLSVLAFPLVYNAVVHYGFYSFAMSLAVYCFFVGYWLRHAERVNPRVGVNVVLVTVLLYLTHVITMGLAYLTAAIISATWWAAEVGKRYRAASLDRDSLVRTTVNLIVKPLIPILPAVILLMAFLSGREQVFLPGYHLGERLKDFVHLGVLYAFQWRELILASLLALGLWALTLWFIVDEWGQRRLQRGDVFLVLAGVFTVGYFLTPNLGIVAETNVPGGAFIKERLNLFPYLALLLWLATRRFSVARRRFVEVFGVTVSLAFIVVHVWQYIVINRQVDEYLTAMSRIEPGATVLPVHAGYRGIRKNGAPLTNKVDPFLNVSNRIAAERPIVVLLNYEAALGYFPVRFRPSRSPYIYLGDIEAAPPKLDLASYARTTGGRIDYVLVWLGRKLNVEAPDMQVIYSQLDQDYQRVFMSKNGLAELYQRR